MWWRTVNELRGPVCLVIAMDVQLVIVIKALSPFASDFHIDFLTLFVSYVLKLRIFQLPLLPTGLAGQKRHQIRPGPTIQFANIPLHHILRGDSITAEELIG